MLACPCPTLVDGQTAAVPAIQLLRSVNQLCATGHDSSHHNSPVTAEIDSGRWGIGRAAPLACLARFAAGSQSDRGGGRQGQTFHERTSGIVNHSTSPPRRDQLPAGHRERQLQATSTAAAGFVAADTNGRYLGSSHRSRLRYITIEPGRSDERNRGRARRSGPCHRTPTLSGRRAAPHAVNYNRIRFALSLGRASGRLDGDPNENGVLHRDAATTGAEDSSCRHA